MTVESYQEAVNLFDRVLGAGNDDEWAYQYAPAGSQHTLADGTTVLVHEKHDKLYVVISLDESSQSYAVETADVGDDVIANLRKNLPA